MVTDPNLPFNVLGSEWNGDFMVKGNEKRISRLRVLEKKLLFLTIFRGKGFVCLVPSNVRIYREI